MIAIEETQSTLIQRIPVWALAATGAILIWLSQPPFGLSVIAWVAFIPWLVIADRDTLCKRQWLHLYLAMTVYWCLTMQGIRHAHDVFYAILPVLGSYLAIYYFLFVVLVRRTESYTWKVPFWLSVPVIGTGLECLRNYLLTGVSAAMIGHTQVDHPAIIQIADTFGSYGVTFLVLLVNAALYETFPKRGQDSFMQLLKKSPDTFFPLGIACALFAVNWAYGTYRIRQGESLAQSVSAQGTMALIGRDEEIVFEQNSERELEIFDNYFRTSIEAAKDAAQIGQTLDAVVWPESMYNGTLPWLLLDEPGDLENLSPDDTELISIIRENRKQFQLRSAKVQASIRNVTGQTNDPHLIVGCSVVHYQEPAHVYSGIVHIGDRGNVVDWYGKTHLVMMGEYIPLIDYFPFIKSLIPVGMGTQRGDGPRVMTVSKIDLSPNVCIETAVERVTPSHIANLLGQGKAADVIVNVTNDGWFDHSSIVKHHLRCSRFVAITCRRPVLMSANGGPTVWIDASGVVVKDLPGQRAGWIIVPVKADSREAVYLTIGDWPARILALFCFIALAAPVARRTKTLFFKPFGRF